MKITRSPPHTQIIRFLCVFQFGSLGVLSYAAVTDIQKQEKLNDLESRLKVIEDSEPSLTKSRISSVCEKVPTEIRRVILNQFVLRFQFLISGVCHHKPSGLLRQRGFLDMQNYS